MIEGRAAAGGPVGRRVCQVSDLEHGKHRDDPADGEGCAETHQPATSVPVSTALLG